MNKTSLLCLLFSLLCVAGHGKSIPLVSAGQPRVSLVLAARPVKAAQLGAYELQHVIRLMTGSTLPIVREKPQTGTLPIFIGESTGTRLRGMVTSDYPRETYEVKCFPDAIVLMGGDEPDFGTVDYQQLHTFPRTRLNRYATLFAVYDFLEKACGVRFYMPGDIGIAFKPAKELSITPLQIRRQPSVIGMRESTLGVPWRIRHQSTPRDRALLKFRWRMNTLYGQADHNTYGFYYRYWKKSTTSKPAADVFVESHPEYFAKGYSGQSAGSSPYVFPNDPDLPPNLCFSHPDVLRILAEQAQRASRGEHIPWTAQSGMKRLAGYPYTYPMLTEDNNLYCQCDACQKLIPPGVNDQDQRTWIYFGFINSLCRAVARLDPSISIAAGVYACPMQDVPLEKNMSLQLQFGVNTWYLPVIRNRHLQIYDYWKKKAGDRPLTLWLYMLSPYWDMLQNDRPQKFFPGFYPHGIVPIARMFVKDGIHGWFSETFIDYTYLETYLALAICYDRDFPAEQEIKNFFPNFFGAAAEPMRAYWQEVEQAFWNEKSYSPAVRKRYTGILNIWNHTYEVNWKLGTKQRIAKLDRLIRQAETMAQTPMEKQRLDYVRKTIHNQMMEGRKDYDKYLSVLNNPVPAVVVPMGPVAHQNPNLADFSHAPVQGPFKSIYHAPDHGQLTMALYHDNHALYLRFNEGKTLPAKGTVNEWTDNVEIFLARKANQYPYHHLVITPQGTLLNYLHAEVNGVVRTTKTAAPGKIQSSKTPTGWTFTLALPLDAVLPDHPLQAGDSFRMNIMRTRPDGNHASWSPLFDRSYLSTLHRMGWVTLTGSKTRNIDVQGKFGDYSQPVLNRKLWTYWLPDKAQSHYALIPGRGLKLVGGAKGPAMILRFAPKIPAGAGNQIVFRFRASGKGTNTLRVAFHENLPNDKVLPRYKENVGAHVLPIQVTPEPKDFVLRAPIVNPEKAKTTHVNFWLWTHNNAELLINNLTVAIEEMTGNHKDN